jgi:hypothetical protein
MAFSEPYLSHSGAVSIFFHRQLSADEVSELAEPLVDRLSSLSVLLHNAQPEE